MKKINFLARKILCSNFILQTLFQSDQHLRIRIRIREAQNPTDPDLEHCLILINYHNEALFWTPR